MRGSAFAVSAALLVAAVGAVAPHGRTATNADGVVTAVSGDYFPLGTKIAADCHWDTNQPAGAPTKSPGHFFTDLSSVVLHDGFASLGNESSTAFIELIPIHNGTAQHAETCSVNFNTIVPARAPVELLWTGTLTLLTLRQHDEWDQTPVQGNANRVHKSWGEGVTFEVYDPKSPCTFHVAKIAAGKGPNRTKRLSEAGADVALAVGDIVSAGDTVFTGVAGEESFTAPKQTLTLPAGFETRFQLAEACDGSDGGVNLASGQTVLDTTSTGQTRFFTLTDESMTAGVPTKSGARYKVWRVPGTRTTISYALRGSIDVSTSPLHRNQKWDPVYARQGQRVVAIAGKRPTVLGKPKKG